MALQDDTLLNYVHVFMFCCLLRSYFHIFAKIHQHAICISSHVNKKRICHFSTKSEAFLIITGRGDLTTLNSQSQILFLIFSFTKSSPYLFFYIDNFEWGYLGMILMFQTLPHGRKQPAAQHCCREFLGGE